MTVRGAMMRTPNVEVPPMARKAQLSLDYAVDLWLGELARQGRAATTRRAAGLTHRQVATELGIARSYASVLASDPEGAQQRARRETYDGVCIDCGGVTKSNGTSQASTRCIACSTAAQSAERKWSPETVVDAIQRFAEIHGRPPTTTEWMTSDAANGYPATSSVHQANGHNPSAPFRFWADAIEAAGFPRPQSGHYPRRERSMSSTRSFFIFEEVEDDLWRRHPAVAAHNEQQAVERHITELAATNGAAEHRYVAISDTRWTIRQLQAVTTYRAVPA